MNELINQQREEIAQLKAERDALAAQVGALKEALKPAVRLMRTTGQYSGWHEKADEAESLVNRELTTQHHLLELRAETAKAALLKLAEEYRPFGLRHSYTAFDVANHVSAQAEYYADSIRQPQHSTWLRDENVKSAGKRGEVG